MKKIKINLPENYKKVYTIEDVEIMKELARNFNDQTAEEAGIADAANTLARLFDSSAKVLEAEAETAKNARIYDYYTGAKDVDIWITVKILGWQDFYIVGAYLSDIWSITGDNTEELKSRMYIRRFTEMK